MKNSIKFKQLILVALSLLMVISTIPVASTKAGSNVDLYPYTLFAASSDDGAFTINAKNFCLNGNIATNGTIVSNGNININGQKMEHANETQIIAYKKIDDKYFTGKEVERHPNDLISEESNIEINLPVEVLGEVTFTGKINIHSALKAMSNVELFGEVNSTNNSVIFSKYGDIIIDSLNTELNGLVYAPFGEVKINAQNLNLNNVVIIADTITLNCDNINANYSSNVAEFIGVDTENYVVPYDDYIYFLEMSNEIYGANSEDELYNGMLQLNETTSKFTDTEIEYYGEAVQEYITDISEIYGTPVDMLTELTYEDIAKIIISAQYGIEPDEVETGEPINLLDANDIVTYIGFNYYAREESGYITVATHSKEVLIREIVENKSLPSEFEKMYYLSSGEFYYENSGYYTLDGVYIEKEEFKTFLGKRKDDYYSFTINILADLENNLISQLNNIMHIHNCDEDDEWLQKSYNGQSGYGYGGIDDCKKYLKDRYGGTITLSSQKTLPMENFRQADLAKNANNCSLTAITRILYYYYNAGYTKIDDNYIDIYREVEKVAKKYGYTASKGTFPTKINNIVEDVLKGYGYSKSKCKGVYVWYFGTHIKNEIDDKKPVIMNIARGYYGNHTVTVCGYAVYKRTKKTLGIKITKTYRMIQVYDGWSSDKKYIDYSAFAYDLVTSGFGSFNTITMKK